MPARSVPRPPPRPSKRSDADIETLRDDAFDHRRGAGTFEFHQNPRIVADKPADDAGDESVGIFRQRDDANRARRFFPDGAGYPPDPVEPDEGPFYLLIERMCVLGRDHPAGAPFKQLKPDGGLKIRQ